MPILYSSAVSFFRLASILLLLAISSPAYAWQPKGDEVPEPVEEKIEVRDNISKLNMICTYYPSTLGKAAVPVLLLHGHEGNRSDYDFLARELQRQGHAVLVPDLRGHGDSDILFLANGREVKLDPKKMRKADFLALVKDLEAVKSFLLKKNNAEELNMEMLTVVGADMTTVTAMNFALRDWTAPELLNFKNCKDVKAAVLLTPEMSYQGADMKAALAHGYVGHTMSVLVVVGKKSSRDYAEAKKIVNLLEKQHGQPSDAKPVDKQVVFLEVDTPLQGTKLLDRNLGVVPVISAFIEFRVKAFSENYEYTARERP